MNATKLNDWLQVIGLFGVIGSLIFVGLQMQQDRAIALSEAYQTRTSISLSLDRELRSNPELVSAALKLFNDDPAFTPEQSFLVTSYIGSLLEMYENLHFQYINGFLDEEHWNRVRIQVKTVLLSRNVRELTLNRLDVQSFRASFIETVRKIDAEDLGQQ